MLCFFNFERTINVYLNIKVGLKIHDNQECLSVVGFFAACVRTVLLFSWEKWQKLCNRGRGQKV